MNRLSKAQVAFLRCCVDAGTVGHTPACQGQRDAGRIASAWHRTATSLAKRGLVKLTRTSGDNYRAFAIQEDQTR